MSRLKKVSVWKMWSPKATSTRLNMPKGSSVEMSVELATVRSWRSMGACPSITTTATWAMATPRRVPAAVTRSRLLVTLARRRRPAVSINRTERPPVSHSIGIASRVRPGSAPVSTRSAPMRPLINVDLPTF